MEEVEGVGGGPAEGVLVENLFCEGADQRFPTELAMMVLFSALEDVVEVKGAFGGKEYIIYNIHIRLTLKTGGGGGAMSSAAERAQGAELS